MAGSTQVYVDLVVLLGTDTATLNRLGEGVIMADGEEAEPRNEAVSHPRVEHPPKSTTHPASQAGPVPRMTRLPKSRTIEIVVPVRPGDRDRFPVTVDPSRINARVLECTDGNLSRLYRDAYLDSRADLVLFKHDDFCFRHWESFEGQAWDLLSRYPISEWPAPGPFRRNGFPGGGRPLNRV